MITKSSRIFFLNLTGYTLFNAYEPRFNKKLKAKLADVNLLKQWLTGKSVI